MSTALRMSRNRALALHLPRKRTHRPIQPLRTNESQVLSLSCNQAPRRFPSAASASRSGKATSSPPRRDGRQHARPAAGKRLVTTGHEHIGLRAQRSPTSTPNTRLAALRVQFGLPLLRRGHELLGRNGAHGYGLPFRRKRQTMVASTATCAPCQTPPSLCCAHRGV